MQLLELSDVDTGIELPSLIDTADWLATEIRTPAKGFVRHTGAVPGIGHTAKPLDFSW